MRIFPILFKVAMLAPVLSVGYALTAHAGSTQNLFKPIVIDFEKFEAGTFITGDEWAEYGVDIKYKTNNKLKQDGKSNLPLRLYDSNCRPQEIPIESLQSGDPLRSLDPCTGDDGDLATGEHFGSKAQGNVLIIQEDNSKSGNRDDLEDLGEADDDKGGGTITFNFDRLIRYVSVGFLDFDESGRKANRATFRFDIKEDRNDTPLQFKIKDVEAVDPNFTGDNSLRLFENVVDQEPVPFNRLRIKIPGSGAITHLCFSPEVAPGGSHNWADEADSCYW